MGSLSKALLLFAMNWLDAQLTILWVRLNIATEGNGIMAPLLAHSEGSFLLVKLCVGAFAAYMLYTCAHLPIARRGMKIVLAVYLALMIVHGITGYSAFGWHAPAIVVGYLGSLPKAVLASFS